MFRQRLAQEAFEKGKAKRDPMAPRVRAAVPCRPYDLFGAREEPLVGAALEGATFEEEDFSGIEVANSAFSCCSFRKCDFTGAYFKDVRFKNCDLSNGSFERAVFERCVIETSKCLGASFSRGLLREVVLQGTDCSLASFYQARWRNVLLRETNLSEATLSEGDFKLVSINECNLIAAECVHVKFIGIDFTTSQIEGLVVSAGLDELFGSKMDAYQAAVFARQLGLVVE